MRKRKIFKYIFPVIFVLVFLFPTFSFAANEDKKIPLNLDYPTFGEWDLNDNQNLNEIVAWFYSFIVMVSGFATFVMLVWGGVQWLSSAGNPGAISDAQDRIKNALLGLLLILLSYVILQIINPELTTLQLPSI